MRQVMEWGYIDWEYFPDSDHPKRSMSVGIVVLLPGKQQRLHVHYGHEQMLYVLQGKGESLQNGEITRFQPGSFFTLEADSTHSLKNETDEPIIELLVSNPVPLAGNSNFRDVEFGIHSLGKNSEDEYLLYSSTENLKSSLLDNISVPYAIFDNHMQLVIRNMYYPDSCLKCCDPVDHPNMCNCYKYSAYEHFHSQEFDFNYEIPDRYTCSNGRETLVFPILFQGRIIGTIRGGHYFTSTDGLPAAEKIDYDLPKSTIHSIIKIFAQISQSIEQYCNMLYSVSQLEYRKKALSESLLRNKKLEESLTDVEEKVTNLKINHHFLFNTLNCMAGIALTGDRFDLYTSIINLSKMFRYTMVSNNKKVTLRRELEYLETYLALQQLRYQDEMEVIYNVDQECLDLSVPFNFLQPIAENAFTHGFMSYDYKKLIQIDVCKRDMDVRIAISNNGIRINDDDCRRIQVASRSGSGHGLSLIYEKLKQTYGENFQLSIGTQNDGMTCVEVILPS